MLKIIEVKETIFNSQLVDNIYSIDKTIKNIQAWTRHLYVNETGIADDIQKKIEGLKMAKQLEEQEDSYEENIDETVADYGDEGFDVDEEFEVDI